MPCFTDIVGNAIERSLVMDYSAMATIVLLAFYLYLLVRPQYVRNNNLFLIGAAGLLLGFVGSFFTIGYNRDVMIVSQVLHCVGSLAAFVGAVGACMCNKGCAKPQG